MLDPKGDGDPGNGTDGAATRVTRGVELLEAGDPAGALAELDRAVERAPDDPLALRHRGRARRASGDLAGAIADYDRALALDPAAIEVHKWRAIARMMGEDFAAALPDLDRFLADHPDDPDALFNRALCRRKTGEPARALPDLDRFLELAPEDPDGHGARGRARRLAGDLPGALADLRRGGALGGERAAEYAEEADDVEAELGGWDGLVDIVCDPGPAFPDRCSCCDGPAGETRDLTCEQRTGHNTSQETWVAVPTCAACAGHLAWDSATPCSIAGDAAWVAVGSTIVGASLTGIVHVLLHHDPTVVSALAGLAFPGAVTALYVRRRLARRAHQRTLGPEHRGGCRVGFVSFRASGSRVSTITLRMSGRRWIREFLALNPGATVLRRS